MSSQVISYRLSTNEVLALREKALPGESDNQTAQRLMRQMLDVSTELSTPSTIPLSERIESIVEDRFSFFAANQNDLLSRLQERLEQLETQVKDLRSPSNNAVVLPVDSIVDKTLTQIELAKRLGVDSATLTKNRAKPNFPDWSQSKDPESRAWSYLAELKRYTHKLSTDVSTESTALEVSQEPVGEDWRTRVDKAVDSL
jgi:hypothetical protein